MIHKDRDPFQINLEKQVLGKIREIVQDKIPQALEQKEELKTVGVEEALRELLTILTQTSGGTS